MKRSQMLKDLAEVLKNLEMKNVTIKPLVKAEAILSFIEVKGMTPPLTKREMREWTTVQTWTTNEWDDES